MTEHFRTKLLHWYASMLLLLLLTVLEMIYAYLDMTTRLQFHPADGADMILVFTTISIFPVLFLPVALWHLADFATREAAPFPRAFSYFAIAGLLVTLGLILCLAALDRNWGIFCSEPTTVQVEISSGKMSEFVVYEECGLEPMPGWLLPFMYASYLSIWLLALGKVIVLVSTCIKSRSKSA